MVFSDGFNNQFARCRHKKDDLGEVKYPFTRLSGAKTIRRAVCEWGRADRRAPGATHGTGTVAALGEETCAQFSRCPLNLLAVIFCYCNGPIGFLHYKKSSKYCMNCLAAVKPSQRLFNPTLDAGLSQIF